MSVLKNLKVSDSIRALILWPLSQKAHLHTYSLFHELTMSQKFKNKFWTGIKQTKKNKIYTIHKDENNILFYYILFCIASLDSLHLYQWKE